MTSEGGQEEKQQGIKWQPLQTIKEVEFDPNWNKFPPPFASKAEHGGFLYGTEHNVLCTKRNSKEAIVSCSFVQCSGALLLNRETNLISLIHESVWSAATGAILAMQRAYPLEVITIRGPIGMIRFSDISGFHNRLDKSYQKSFLSIDRKNPQYYRPQDKRGLMEKHAFLDYSSIRGIGVQEVTKMFEKSMNEDVPNGGTKLIGEIEIPVSEQDLNRWSLTYRAKENKIHIYESGTDQIFTYQGFP